jgi:hypothetical protein
MSFIAEARAWFFRNTAPTNTRGAKIHLADKGEPDQDVFERLTQSVPFKKEADDRAKETTGGALEAEVGIVSIATDLEAKANTTGLKVDRTSVVHAGQLPTVDATEVQVISDFNNVALAIAADATATRNNFLAKLSDEFVTWLSDLKASVLTNITNIATNATNIATNTTNIATNAGNITTNTNNISSIQNDGSLAVQKDDATVGTTTSTLNFEGAGVSTVVDEGSNKTTVTISGGGGGSTAFASGGTVISAAVVATGIPAQAITFTNVTATTVNGFCYISGKLEATAISSLWSVGGIITLNMDLQASYQINASVPSNATIGTTYLKGNDGTNLNFGNGIMRKISSTQIGITGYISSTNTQPTTATFHLNASYPLV